MGYARGAEETIKRAPSGQNWNNLSKKLSKAVLDYSPKYKINIRESIIIQIKLIG